MKRNVGAAFAVDVEQGPEPPGTVDCEALAMPYEHSPEYSEHFQKDP